MTTVRYPLEGGAVLEFRDLSWTPTGRLFVGITNTKSLRMASKYLKEGIHTPIEGRDRHGDPAPRKISNSPCMSSESVGRSKLAALVKTGRHAWSLRDGDLRA